ncbi:acetyl-CoA carboxylase biotin carboxyl carrier protein [Botrimarina hoheduenensis]|uniref:Biotin carboxyl carrier protein of acetyl-CoA carboxylase n=1 Tax=Botrimarina hoheduenensis TaxID=2528000 RepID=A0A5C5VX12_9BACT|nr:acetyl-CoA carboxylase biotin carboxyl carrier protein [Botrimarina hoheduenensis]TWT42555.1 Acetyl-CoA biotin carboxyl carrier [Botrimarina hoheduenensis]
MENDKTNSGNDVFDVRRVRRLVELMNEHELAEVDLRQGEQRIRLRRGPETEVLAAIPAAPAPVAPVTPTQATPVSAAAPAAAEPAGKVIPSPMVGTFYASANPDAAPFVKVGDQVGTDSTICIIEAMKVFNEIPAECSGKIVAVLVESGATVEYGQPLFRIE